jgi:hypothetical protein
MIGRILLGFIAGVVAVLLVHQPVVYALQGQQMLPPTIRAYNMGPLATALPAVADAFKSLGFAGWPILFNSMFWGGLWGALFAAVHPYIPGRYLLVKGFLFGMMILIVSNWIALPLIRGQALFANFLSDYNPRRLLPGFLIESGFGLGLGAFYSLFRRKA